MVALRTERRVFLWRVSPRANPSDSGKKVTLSEIVDILEAELAQEKARCYISAGSRLLDDADADRDDKNQIYIAQIRRDSKHETVTLLINRGDPNTVSPAFINTQTSKVRVEHPKAAEAPGWSAHLVISLKDDPKGHRAVFEKMPRLSSEIVTTAIDRIIGRAVSGDPNYTFTVDVKEGKGKSKKVVKQTRNYRPTLFTKRIPSEKLELDLEKGELAGITLTKQTQFYAGVGVDKIVKRQEEKIVIRTSHADKNQVSALIKGIVKKGRDEGYEAISFDIGNLPGKMSNKPTLSLDDRDALEQLYVRAQRLDGFAQLLEACYPTICPQIEAKMIEMINGSHGW